MTEQSLHKLFDLHGRVALVTGGSRGLGLQLAEALGEFGARLVLVARKQDELDQAVAHLCQRGITARAVAGDLGAKDAAQSLVADIAAHEKRLDIVVNNAGATWGAAAEDFPLDHWNRIIGLNVSAQFQLIQATARTFFLPQGKGAVVNVASIEGLQAHPANRIGTIAYNTSKGALVNMTRALAAEWGPKNIRVNALAPGYFPTRMTHAALDRIGDDVISATPLGKLGGADDLKGAALLLASDAGGHITGQVIVVDGGATII